MHRSDLNQGISSRTCFWLMMNLGVVCSSVCEKKSQIHFELLAPVALIIPDHEICRH
jgi:hypothetical protein